MAKTLINKQYKQLINHISFVLDSSGSMQGLTKDLLEVFNNQISLLKTRSNELNQETRVSVYTFASDVNCLCFDVDINRIPDISHTYRAIGNTALLDGVLKAIEDSEKIPQVHGDHAFLIITLTDGQENYSDAKKEDISRKIKSLKENFTISILVPNEYDARQAQSYGFPENNVSVWEVSSKGLKNTGVYLASATNSYLMGRSSGIRSTNNFFNLKTDNLKSSIVKNNLLELSPVQYNLLPVHKDSVIKSFVESCTSYPYRPGSAFYLLTKPELIQNHKQIVIQNKLNGKVYSGTNARSLLGLPDYEIKVSPSNYSDFDVFVQSTSLNRKLLSGSKVIVLL